MTRLPRLQTLSHKALLPPHVEIFIIPPFSYSSDALANEQRFNIASHTGDEPKVVEKSRELLKRGVSRKLTFLRQVHGTKIVRAGCNKRLSGYPTSGGSLYDELSSGIDVGNDVTGDGIITDSSDYACFIQTADCVPLLLYSSSPHEIAAIHIGWRGLLAGIISTALQHFDAEVNKLGAFIGPAIGEQHFELDSETSQGFVKRAQEIGYQPVVKARQDRFFVDLKETVKRELAQLGVRTIYKSRLCTYEDPRLPSYRRATHQSLVCRDRLISLIRFKD